MSEAGSEEGGAAAQVAAAAKRRRRWPWILLLALVLLVVGLRAALPWVVERGAAYASRYWLGLPVRIDNADFDLLGGSLLLEGVSVGAAPDAVSPSDAAFDPPPIDADSALFRLDRIALRISWDELRNNTVKVTELALSAPRVRVVREADGSIDPLRHAVPLAPPDDEAPEEGEEEPGEPWTVAVDRFALSTPNVVIVDLASGDSLLEFSLEEFALDRIVARGGDFALGGVGIEGPVLRVRRDLVLAAPTASAPAKAPERGPSDAKPEGARPEEAKPATPPAASTGSAIVEVAPDAATVEGAQAVETAADASTSEAAPPASAAGAPSSPAAKDAAAGYRIEKIDIERATFTWVTDKGPLDVALSLHARDITADEGKRFPIDLQLEIEKGRVAIAGEVGVLPPAYQGKVAWTGLPFPPLLLASVPDLAAWLRSAASNASLQIDADIAGVHGPPAFHMSGQVSVEELSVADPGNKEIAVGWKHLEVVMNEVLVPLPEEGKPPRKTIASFDLVKLLEPRIHYTHPAPALNAMLGIETAAPAPAAETDAKADAKPETPDAKKSEAKAPDDAKKEDAAARKDDAAPQKNSEVTVEAPAKSEVADPLLDVSITLLELDDGDLQVVDTSVTPPVTSTAKDLFVLARNVHFPDPSAKAVSLSATLPTSSALTLRGELRPGNNGDFTLSLQKLDLPRFSPYAAAAGASLDAGQASVTTKLKLRGKVIDVDNELVLRKFGVSLRDPSSFDRSFGMPVDLALALLRDPSGDIKLKIPVRIDEKGAQVSMGAIIASALKAALLGAVTAPLKMLGAAFGGGEGEGNPTAGIAPVASVAGKSELAPDAGDRAEGLAKLLAERPAMAVELSGRTGPEDRPLLAEQMLVERLEAGQGLPEMKDSSFLARRRVSAAFLAKSAKKPPKEAPKPLAAEDQALYERYVAATEVPVERFDALAAARAEALKALMLERKVETARVTVGAREADGSPAVVLTLKAR